MQRVKEARRHTARGLRAYSAGDLGIAEWEFTVALSFAERLGPGVETSRRAYVNLAIVHIEQEQFPQGAQVLLRLLGTHPSPAAQETWEPSATAGFYGEAEEGVIGRYGVFDRAVAGPG